MDFCTENAGFLICLHFRSCMTCHQGEIVAKTLLLHSTFALALVL